MKKLLSLALLLAIPAFPQSAITRVDHQAGSAGTVTLNTTGSSLLTACVYRNSPVSDSQGNTWQTILTGSGYNVGIILYAVFNPKQTGTPSADVITTGGGGGAFETISAASYAHVTSGPDQTSTNGGCCTTTQPGSITPAHADELVQECLGTNPPSTPTISISSGFSTPDTVSYNNGGYLYSISTAEQIQTTATAVNPTWTNSPGANTTAVQASFFGELSPAPLAMNTTSFPEAVTGTAYSYTLPISGGTNPVSCSITSGTLPTGLSLSGCTISGTPTGTTQSGIVIEATDSTSPTPQTASTGSLTLYVASSALAITTTTCPDGKQLTNYAGCTIAASGGIGAYTFGWTNSTTFRTDAGYDALPAGLYLTPSTGVISSTPVQGQGLYEVQFTVADSGGATATAVVQMSIAGDNTFGGQQLGPSDSAWHINLLGLPVSTSPISFIPTPFAGRNLQAGFGQEPYYIPGMPINTVPYNQPNVTVTPTAGAGPIFFPSAPINCNAAWEGTWNAGSDNHIPTVRLAGGSNPLTEFDLYYYYPSPLQPYNATCTFTGNGYQFSHDLSGTNAYSLISGTGSTDAAGLPLAPLLVNVDEIIGACTLSAPCGAVKHPIRITVPFYALLNLHVWPATSQPGTYTGCSTGGFQDPTGNGLTAQSSTAGTSVAGYGPPTCTGYTGPGSLPVAYGQIFRLKSSKAEPAACASNPLLHIFFVGLQQYGIITADNGDIVNVIGTTDSRWPVYTTVNACVNAILLSDFEPVAVDSLAVNITTSSQTTSGSSASAPTASPASGTYTGTQSVTLSTSSSGAVICYNTSGSPATNGSTGCTTGTLYSGAISVSSSETIYAVAGGTGYTDSSVGTFAYTIQSAASAPTYSPASGTYTGTQSVTLSTASSGCTSSIVWNTSNASSGGNLTGTSSTNPLSVAATETVYSQVQSCNGYGNSSISSASYTINSVATTINSTSGKLSIGGNVQQ